ncbi:MAG: hypothetical protein MMC23_004751 [Stictis urceolatum]|nr:hypothetical protein [Stictis urceolata]
MELGSLPQRHAQDDIVSTTAQDEPAPSSTSALPPITQRDQLLVLLSGFTAVLVTIGPNLSYGVFQSHYTSPSSPLPPPEQQSTALIALVGTLGAGLTWGGSIFISPLLSRARHPSHLPLLGSLLSSLSFLLASFARSTVHLLLTQGLLYGIGSSLLYFPLITVAPPYFASRRASAMGLILSAAGLGGLAYSLLIRALLSTVGSSWTLRILALLTLTLSLPAAYHARPSRTPAHTSQASIPRATARKPAFALQALAALLQAAGNFVPMTFAPQFSTAVGYPASFGAALLALNNGVNALARILTGVLADRFGRQNVLVLSVVGSAGAVLGLWLAAVGSAGRESGVEMAQGLWVGFVVLYGVLAGGYMSLFPVAIVEVFGAGSYAGINSFLYFVRGCGAMFGSPVGGQILGEASGQGALREYRRLVWYDGALLLGSAVCVVGVRGFDAVERKAWKWKA